MRFKLLEVQLKCELQTIGPGAPIKTRLTHRSLENLLARHYDCVRFVSVIRGGQYMKTTLFILTLVLSIHSSAFAAIKFDAGVDATLQKQINDDLSFMAQIQGNAGSGLHQQIFGAVSGPAYATWFQKRIFSVGKNDCGSAIAVACVIPFQNPNKMWVTPNYSNFNHPQIARVSVIYHEARHSETNHGNWSHAKCPTPFKDAQGKDIVSIWTGAQLQGQPACDITPFGSYGSQTILLKNIAKNCSNCNSKVKADAEMFGTDQFGRIIDAKSRTQMSADFAKSI